LVPAEGGLPKFCHPLRGAFEVEAEGALVRLLKLAKPWGCCVPEKRVPEKPDGPARYALKLDLLALKNVRDC
jgi:hypothetical protein